MPCRYRRERDIAIVEGVGRYDVSELRAAFEASLPVEGPAARGLILDVSDSESLHARSPQDVRAMAYFVASLGDRFARRFAIVAWSDHDFGLMRLGSVVTESEGIVTHVFRDPASAMAWLAPEA